MTRVGILVLLLILKEKLSVFHHLCNLAVVYHKWPLLCSDIFPLYQHWGFFSWIGVGFYTLFIEMIREGNGNPLQYSCLENSMNSMYEKEKSIWHWKPLKEMGASDHLTCLLRNLYVGQEATIRTGYETPDWFKIGKGGQ